MLILNEVDHKQSVRTFPGNESGFKSWVKDYILESFVLGTGRQRVTKKGI